MILNVIPAKDVVSEVIPSLCKGGLGRVENHSSTPSGSPLQRGRELRNRLVGRDLKHSLWIPRSPARHAPACIALRHRMAGRSGEAVADGEPEDDSGLNDTKLKDISESEMKAANIFAGLSIDNETIVGLDGTDRCNIVKTESYRVSELAKCDCAETVC